MVLMVGQSSSAAPQPKGLDGDDAEEAAVGVSVIGRRSSHQAAKRRKRGSMAGAVMSVRHPEQKGRAWIEKKKVALYCQPIRRMHRDHTTWSAWLVADRADVCAGEHA